jgi:hypothetical protein
MDNELMTRAILAGARAMQEAAAQIAEVSTDRYHAAHKIRTLDPKTVLGVAQLVLPESSARLEAMARAGELVEAHPNRRLEDRRDPVEPLVWEGEAPRSYAGNLLAIAEPRMDRLGELIGQLTVVATIGKTFQIQWARKDWSQGLKVGDNLLAFLPPEAPALPGETT